MAKASYVVTGEYVTLTTEGVLHGFYRGATVPGDVPAEQIKHHLDRGLIAMSGEAEKDLAAQPDEVPSATGSSGPVPGTPAAAPVPAPPASRK